MTDQQQSPQLDALRALNELVTTARTRGLVAKELGHTKAAFALLSIARDLDAARTCLVQEGESYLEAAWAFIDTGRKLIARWLRAVNLGWSAHDRA